MSDALLLEGIAKARPWFAGLQGAVSPEAEPGLAEVVAALDRLRDVMGKSGAGAPFDTSKPADPRLERLKAAIAEASCRRREQTSRRRANCTVRAAFIRTRRRKLQGLSNWGATEAVSFDVVRSGRTNGKVMQHFVVGLGTLKRGCGGVRDDAAHRRRFVEEALRKLLWYGLPHDLEDKLLAELAAKAGLLVEDLDDCRTFRHRQQEHGEDQAEAIERLDRLDAAMTPAGRAATWGAHR